MGRGGVGGERGQKGANVGEEGGEKEAE